VLCGLGAGALVGYMIYKGGNKTSLQIFLVISTCFLYLVAAGLFSKGVWNLEQDAWVRLAGEGAAEAGAGPGSYDIRKSVWHVNVSRLTSFMIGVVLICWAVLLTPRQWRRWLGYFQLTVRMAKQRDVWLRHLLQSLLGRCHCWLLVPWVEGEQADRRVG
jgi:FTR1 family protein